MWKDYSSGFIKNNKASSLSIMAAALIAALFLSFLCTLFYNFWMDETGTGTDGSPEKSVNCS